MKSQPEWLVSTSCEMYAITETSHFAALASLIAADLALRDISPHSVLRLREIPLSQIGCGPDGRLVEALLGPPEAPAQASWLEAGGNLLALETGRGRELLAHGFDARRIPDPDQREAALLDWLTLLTALPGDYYLDRNKRPFRLWRSGAEVAALHPPGIAQLNDTFLPARVKIENSGSYHVDCVLSHGNHLFSTTIIGTPGEAPEMSRADLLVELPPGRIGYGPNGWLFETVKRQEVSRA